MQHDNAFPKRDIADNGQPFHNFVAHKSAFDRAREANRFVRPRGRSKLRMIQEIAEAPYLSMSKRQLKPVHYRGRKGTYCLDVRTSGPGYAASVFDADLLIWLVAEILDQFDRGGQSRAALEEDRSIYFNPHTFLRDVDHAVGGRDYRRFFDSLDRLNHTGFRLKQGTQRVDPLPQSFQLIERWDYEESEKNGSCRGVRVKASPWLFRQATQPKKLLAVDPGFVNLTSGFERRLYLIGRKHAHGTADGFSIKLSTLHCKMGSSQPLASFHRDLKLHVREPTLGYIFEWLESADGEPMLNFKPDKSHWFIAGLQKSHLGAR